MCNMIRYIVLLFALLLFIYLLRHKWVESQKIHVELDDIELKIESANDKPELIALWRRLRTIGKIAIGEPFDERIAYLSGLLKGKYEVCTKR